jgi:hypothetical protein
MESTPKGSPTETGNTTARADQAGGCVLGFLPRSVRESNPLRNGVWSNCISQSDRAWREYRRHSRKPSKGAYAMLTNSGRRVPGNTGVSPRDRNLRSATRPIFERPSCTIRRENRGVRHGTAHPRQLHNHSKETPESPTPLYHAARTQQ